LQEFGSSGVVQQIKICFQFNFVREGDCQVVQRASKAFEKQV
jgi:hypothetical protein